MCGVMIPKQRRMWIIYLDTFWHIFNPLQTPASHYITHLNTFSVAALHHHAKIIFFTPPSHVNHFTPSFCASLHPGSFVGRQSWGDKQFFFSFLAGNILHQVGYPQDPRPADTHTHKLRWIKFPRFYIFCELQL